MAADSEKILALDIGNARIGMALANMAARIASPAGALPNNDQIYQQLSEVCHRESVKHIVIGLPRGLDGQETNQTATVQAFATKLMQQLAMSYSWQDEAVTSAQAEAELRARKKPYTKADIDALAATYILEDYLREKI